MEKQTRTMETRTCVTCGEPKEPEEFYIKDKNTGRRDTICITCVKLKRKELYHILHPLARTISLLKDDFHCTGCGELKTPDDFFYRKTGPYQFHRRMPCKVCQRLKKRISYRDLKDKNKHVKNDEKSDLPEREIDYADFKHLVGRYQICPQCEINRPLADFTEIKQKILRCYGYEYKYIIKYREVYSECSDCRNRMHVLYDQFILAAF